MCIRDRTHTHTHTHSTTQHSTVHATHKQPITITGSGLGSGSGDDQLRPDPVPFTCTSDTVYTLELEIFDVFATKLAQLLACSPTNESDQLLYTITVLETRETIEIAAATDTIDDHFDQGMYEASVEVCLLGSGLSCDESSETQTYSNVTIVVGPNTKRLFPYGAGDERVSNIDDVTFDVVSSDGIPLWTSTYNTIHVSDWYCLDL